MADARGLIGQRKPPLRKEMKPSAADVRQSATILPESLKASNPHGRTSVASEPTPSPLAGQRLLMTFPETETPVGSHCDGLAARLACAESFFTHGIETVLAPVGASPSGDALLDARRRPGVSVWPEVLPAKSGAALADAVDCAEADLVLTHDPRLIATRGTGRPTIVCCADSPILRWRLSHGAETPPDGLRLDAVLERAGLLAADEVVVPSRSFAEALRAVHDLTRLPLVAASAFMNRPGLPGATTFIEDLLSGRAAPEKRLDHRFFALTAGRLYDDLTDAGTLDRAAEWIGAMLLAAGPLNPEGPVFGDRRPLQHFGSLHTLGRLSDADMNRLLDHAPVFVSAARHRAFGRILVQAAQRGCALVLSDIPVHREFWRGAATFVAPGDADGFASAIRRGLEDESHRMTMADAALRRVRMLARLWKPDALHDAFATISEGAALTAAE